MDGATNLWKKSLSAINQREIQCFHSSAGAEQKLKWLLQRSLAKLASSLWIISYSRKSSKLGRLLRFHSIDDSTNEFQISFGNTLPMTRVIDDESVNPFSMCKRYRRPWQNHWHMAPANIFGHFPTTPKCREAFEFDCDFGSFLKSIYFKFEMKISNLQKKFPILNLVY